MASPSLRATLLHLSRPHVHLKLHYTYLESTWTREIPCTTLPLAASGMPGCGFGSVVTSLSGCVLSSVRASYAHLGCALCMCQGDVSKCAYLPGQALVGCTLSPSCLQTIIIHIAQYGRLSWLQRAGIFIWFIPFL